MSLVVCTVLFIFFLRLAYVIYRGGKSLGAKSQKSYSTLIVLGSGEVSDPSIDMLVDSLVVSSPYSLFLGVLQEGIQLR
jgi:hypothetical protein